MKSSKISLFKEVVRIIQDSMRISTPITEPLDLKDTNNKVSFDSSSPRSFKLRDGQRGILTLTLMRLKPGFGQDWSSFGTLIFHFSNGMFGFGWVK